MHWLQSANQTVRCLFASWTSKMYTQSPGASTLRRRALCVYLSSFEELIFAETYVSSS